MLSAKVPVFTYGAKRVNPLPDDKILLLSKLKAFADNLIVAEMVQFFCDRVRNIVGKGENAGYQRFLLCPTMFSKGFFLRVVKTKDCLVKG